MNKEDIIMLAVQTGQAIKNSELMEKYDEISAAYSADTELQEKVREYNADQEALAQESAKEDPNEFIVKALSERIEELYSDITHNNNFEAFAKIQDEVRALIDEVNGVIMAQVTGHESSGGCSGDCSHCGGCH